MIPLEPCVSPWAVLPLGLRLGLGPPPSRIGGNVVEGVRGEQRPEQTGKAIATGRTNWLAVDGMGMDCSSPSWK
jgi:hypothetical protein